MQPAAAADPVRRAANLIRRYDERAKRWHDRKLAKTNNVIATKDPAHTF
jgi:hypothetical protein